MIVFATTLLRGVMMTEGPRKKRGRPPNPIPSVEIVRELTEADLQLLEGWYQTRKGGRPPADRALDMELLQAADKARRLRSGISLFVGGVD
jgi:hypothetical protein